MSQYPSRAASTIAYANTAPLTALPTDQTTLVGGRYRLLQTLGKGGFSIVYLAEDLCHPGRLVALKRMRQLGLDAQRVQMTQQMFCHEAQVLNQLAHPRILRLSDVGVEAAGRWHLIMQYIAGESLEQHLQQQSVLPPIGSVLSLGIQLCDVLRYLHSLLRPLVYRDLKPSNVMLTPEGGVVLIDFGIARFYQPTSNQLIADWGTCGYAPPEQYPDSQGMSTFSPGSDIYSLGVLLHQLLSGQSPVAQKQRFAFLPLPRQRFPAAMRPCLDLIQRMLDRTPQKRPPAMEVMRVLLHAQACLTPLG